MKLTDEMIKDFQKKITNATSLEEVVAIAKEMGEDISLEEAAQILEEIPAEIKPLSENELNSVVGGATIRKEDIPMYDTIVNYYMEKGPNLAFIMCVYYIPSPICYEIIQIIEKEDKTGRP